MSLTDFSDRNLRRGDNYKKVLESSLGMEFKQLILDLGRSKEFSSWKKEHPQSFLVHIFVMIEGDATAGYQVGYYDPASNKVTSFLVEEGKTPQALPPAEILEDPEHKIEELDMHGVELSTEDALAKAHEVRDDDYENIPVLKTFFIVQSLHGFGPLFNITFVTRDLKTLNVKISAKTAEVLKHSLDSLVHQVKGEN